MIDVLGVNWFLHLILSMATNCADYDYSQIEAHWQAFWSEQAIFRAETGSPKPKFYCLDMFPYPSGAGLHAGHCENYTGSDVYDRFLRARGYNVLHPMGWDAFGLPAEQYAVKTGTHPALTTAANIAHFRQQIQRLGVAIDWSREINTTDPNYYRWTQWIFLQLFRHGLAYVDERPVWWCPALGTVLANEEVIDGVSEVGGFPVERRALRQWVLRITAYADRLLAGLDEVDWPESTKTQQRNWIGRSEGAEVRFAIEGFDQSLLIYTTRPDTLFGATYMVLAPEHPLVPAITTAEQSEAVRSYQQQVASKSDLDRTELNKVKTGVFTGAYAINPVNGARLPIWIADYVLGSYGTGAIMAVPGQDERDWEFAVAHRLPIIRTVQPPEGWTGQAYTGDGPAIASGFLNGLRVEEAKRRMIAWLEEKGIGRGTVQYRLRDWLFSRQRYWGEPFPILWVDEEAWAAALSANGPVAQQSPQSPVSFLQDGRRFYALPVPAAYLPLTLPEVDNYKPAGQGESPLGNATDWVEVWVDVESGATVPRSQARPPGPFWYPARRETNTMPQWAGSCWYYLRYCDPRNEQALISPEAERYWGVPDFYMGGAEHAVLHLLYARFWHHFLYDIGVVTTREPFRKLFHQGIILGEDGEKMSKSRGNVINPDDYFRDYGADTLRLYEMFMGPLEDTKPWNTSGVMGVARFLRRLWREIIDRDGRIAAKIVDRPETDLGILRILHETIRKVTLDFEKLRFNTAISQLMICLNRLQEAETVSLATIRTYLQLLAPLAPHICEELWARLGGTPSITYVPWPSWDEAYLTVTQIKIGILVNGKPRAEISLPPDTTEADCLEAARVHEKVVPHLAGKSIVKCVYVPGKILNLVVK